MSVRQPMTTTISAKGKIALPLSVRRSCQWKPGTKLIVQQTPEGVLLKPAPVFEETKPEDAFGMVKWTGKPKTLEDMEAGILAEAARQYQGD